MAKLTRGEVIGAITASSANSTNKEQLALAVRLSLDYLAQEFPGNAVELRVPPYRVIQILEGITHRRGTPPAVVEITPDNWIKLLTKDLDWESAQEQGLIQASGERSNLSELLELFSQTKLG